MTLVTVDVLSFTRVQHALRAYRAPATIMAAPPRFARTFITGSGSAVHAPWRRRRATLVSLLTRDDGFGAPDPRRVAVLAVWDGEPPPLVLPRRRRREHWRGVFEPSRVHGTIDGVTPFTADGDRASARGEGAVLTYGRGNRHVVDFMRSVPVVVEDVHAQAGVRCALGFVRPGTRHSAVFSTFTCWSDLSLVNDFAYRASPGHSNAISLSNAGYYQEELLFARLRLVRSSGSIAGRDPFAEVAA